MDLDGDGHLDMLSGSWPGEIFLFRGDARREWMREELARVSPAGLLSSMRSVGRFRSNRWIGEVDVPVSVVVTARDRTVPTRNQRRLARALPAATVHEVAGPHDAIVSMADRYRPAFLDACADASGGPATDS